MLFQLSLSPLLDLCIHALMLALLGDGWNKIELVRNICRPSSDHHLILI